MAVLIVSHCLSGSIYTGEIWERSFISAVRPTVHTNLSWKRDFSKTLFKLEEVENAGFAFWCGLKRSFENGGFRKLWRYDNRVFLVWVFSHTQIMSGDCRVFEFLQRVQFFRLSVMFLVIEHEINDVHRSFRIKRKTEKNVIGGKSKQKYPLQRYFLPFK